MEENKEQKSPEQIKAELKMKEEAKAASLQRKKETAGELHFVANGKVYVPVFPVLRIPTVGERTELEICVDKEAQVYLLKNGEGVIKEIL